LNGEKRLGGKETHATCEGIQPSERPNMVNHLYPEENPGAGEKNQRQGNENNTGCKRPVSLLGRGVPQKREQFFNWSDTTAKGGKGDCTLFLSRNPGKGGEKVIVCIRTGRGRSL